MSLMADAGHVFESGKTYTHAHGLSCTFRQWRADSHCKYLHGYSLQVTIKWKSSLTDERNWVQDFGGLKPLKAYLEDTFDHKTLIARDDPMLNFMMGEDFSQIAQLKVVDHVGCEAFAQMIFEWIKMNIRNNHAYLQEVMVEEHPGNFALYRRAS